MCGERQQLPALSLETQGILLPPSHLHGGGPLACITHNFQRALETAIHMGDHAVTEPFTMADAALQGCPVCFQLAACFG